MTPARHSRIRQVIFSLALLMAIAPNAWTQDEAAPSAEDSAQAQAAETSTTPPAQRETLLHIDHLVGAMYGPLAVMYNLDAYHRWDFFPESKNILLEGAYASIGPTIMYSPGIAYWGASVTIAPLTIFSLNAQFVHVVSGTTAKKWGFLDYTNQTADYPHLGQPGDKATIDGQVYEGGDFSDEYRESYGKKHGQRTAKIWSLFIKPSVFLQAGPIVFVYLGNYMYYHPTAFKGLYYNDYVDMILSPKSWCLMNEMLLLYEIKTLKEDGYGLYAGINNQLTFAIGDGDLLKDAHRWKLGAMAAWTITDQLGDTAIEEPTLILMGHYYIFDPIRISNPIQGIQTSDKRTFSIILALSFSTDWSRDKKTSVR